jgi:hypothetical protein
MKKNLLVLFVALISCTVWSQSVIFGLAGGYCAPLASDTRSVDEIQFENSNFPRYYASYENLKSVSYGQGGNIAFYFDWFSKKNIGCGLKLNAMIGSPFSHTATVYYIDGTVGDYSFEDKGFSFQFIPHINFKHEFKRVTPILELGMLIGVTNIEQSYHASFSKGYQINSTVNDHGNALIGFYSSLGLAFKVSKVVRITLAMTCSAGSYSPSAWSRTSYVVNGQDQLAYLAVGQKEGEYVNELNLKATQSNNVPHQSLKYSAPFSNIGFNAGLAFEIARKKSKEKIKEEQNVVHPF